jgi:hypothetical protein
MGNRNILRDETLFKNPHLFQPERFLEPVDEDTARRRDPKNYAFGFGRRVRPLYLLTTNSLGDMTLPPRSVLEGI